jgi:hypothetical protein
MNLSAAPTNYLRAYAFAWILTAVSGTALLGCSSGGDDIGNAPDSTMVETGEVVPVESARPTPTSLGDFEVSLKSGFPVTSVAGAKGEVKDYFDLMMNSPLCCGTLVRNLDLTSEQLLNAGEEACEVYEDLVWSSPRSPGMDLYFESIDAVKARLAESFVKNTWNSSKVSIDATSPDLPNISERITVAAVNLLCPIPGMPNIFK